MNNPKLTLSIMPHRLAICRLENDAQIPAWATNDTFFSISKNDEELSIVCSESKVPDTIKSDKYWRAIKVIGPLDFSLTGVLASLANPLAKSKISIFAISTFDTDYLLVKDDNLEKAMEVLGTFCNIQR